MIAKFSADRFESNVDEYFYCSVCKEIAVIPVECKECESLLCTDCSSTVIESDGYCEVCSQRLEVQSTSVYALQVYSNYLLTCKNKSSGCPVKTNVGIMLEHEPACQYSKFICESPLCGKECLLIDKYSENPLTCSDLCAKVVDFDTTLDTNDEFQILSKFHGYLKEVKLSIQQEILGKIEKEKQRYDELLKEKERFESKEEPRLLEELELRKYNYHNGTWDKKAGIWTCCNSNIKLSLGCQPL